MFLWKTFAVRGDLSKATDGQSRAQHFFAVFLCRDRVLQIEAILQLFNMLREYFRFDDDQEVVQVESLKQAVICGSLSAVQSSSDHVYGILMTTRPSMSINEMN